MSFKVSKKIIPYSSCSTDQLVAGNPSLYQCHDILAEEPIKRNCKKNYKAICGHQNVKTGKQMRKC